MKDLTTAKQGKATTVQGRSGKCLAEEQQILYISYKDYVTNEEVRAKIQQGKMEKTGCKIICGAPTTFEMKG